LASVQLRSCGGSGGEKESLRESRVAAWLASVGIVARARQDDERKQMGMRRRRKMRRAMGGRDRIGEQS
jgi:hypothetical protein